MEAASPEVREGAGATAGDTSVNEPNLLPRIREMVDAPSPFLNEIDFDSADLSQVVLKRRINGRKGIGIRFPSPLKPRMIELGFWLFGPPQSSTDSTGTAPHE
jgi:hypothetical protein